MKYIPQKIHPKQLRPNFQGLALLSNDGPGASKVTIEPFTHKNRYFNLKKINLLREDISYR